MLKQKHRLIILGSGPAGYTASIYAARANLNPVVISGMQPGGQLINTENIDNWPGNIDKFSGLEFMNRMKKHAEELSVKIIDDHIIDTNFNINPFFLKGQKNEYYCDSIIIATGSSPKYLGLESEKYYIGRGISTCAICDGFFFRQKLVCVVGGGNTAIEETLYLSKIAKSVTLIHRNNFLRADKILQKKILDKVNNPCENIKIFWKSIVIEILGNKNKITGINIKNIDTNEYKNLKIDGIFIAIGHIPNTKVFKNQISMKNGYILTYIKDNCTTSTSIPGIFACGDVVNNSYKQAITAASSGCMAALDAEKYLYSL